MIWYIAVVALVNLGLGYALATYLGVWSRPQALPPIAGDVTAPDSNEATAERLEATFDLNSTGLDSQAEFSVVTTAESPSPEGPLPENADPLTGLKTRAQLEQWLNEMASADGDRQPVSVAMIEVDPPAGGAADACEDRLLRGVAATLRNLLSDVHEAGRFSDQQLLLLMPDDNLQHATALTEHVRQRVATTQYVADGKEIHTTVTCALAQFSTTSTIDSLLEFLTETLDEAKRYGGNRTFMHDGAAPTPVVPPELDYAPQTCAI